MKNLFSLSAILLLLMMIVETASASLIVGETYLGSPNQKVVVGETYNFEFDFNSINSEWGGDGTDSVLKLQNDIVLGFDWWTAIGGKIKSEVRDYQSAVDVENLRFRMDARVSPRVTLFSVDLIGFDMDGKYFFEHVFSAPELALISDHKWLQFSIKSLSRNNGNSDFYIKSAMVELEVIPEPTTLALMGLGLAGIGWKRRKAA